MAKKKGQDTPPKPQEFHTAPFQALKGIQVVPAPQPPPLRPATPKKPPAEDDANLFLQAMDGVRRVGESGAQGSARQPVRSARPTPAAPPVREVEPAEKETFAQAIGRLRLDKTFSEHLPEEEELKPLGTNRLRQLKRGVIELDRQLDLHGLSREEALDALPHFLKSARSHGEKAVLIITGKGNNSPGEPVLQQAVAGWLRDAGREHVVEYAPAPREMGGSGAFVVFLRS